MNRNQPRTFQPYQPARFAQNEQNTVNRDKTHDQTKIRQILMEEETEERPNEQGQTTENEETALDQQSQQERKNWELGIGAEDSSQL